MLEHTLRAFTDDRLRLLLTHECVPRRYRAFVTGSILSPGIELDLQTDADMDPTYEIRFQSLFRGVGLCFPCDEQGRVELDALNDRARENYLYARAVVGMEYAYPKVCRTALCAPGN